MGITGCRIKGIVPATAAQRQIFLHCDVMTHPQPFFQETRYWEEALFITPRCDAGGGRGLGCWWPQRCRVAPPMRKRSKTTSIIEEAFADTDLPVPPGTTPLWGSGAVPGGWADACGCLMPPDSHEKWKSTITRGVFCLTTVPWVFVKKIEAATMRYGFTWHLLTIVETMLHEIQTTTSLTSRKTHARTEDYSVFLQSLKPLFRTFLMVYLLFK